MNIIELLKVFFLGFIEGITEWLPISSTGHMLIVNDFIHLNVSEKFMELFLVVIQLGAILAVVILFFNKVNPFKKDKEERHLRIDLIIKVIIGCIPAAVIGIPFNDWFDQNFYNAPTVATALVVYGILFIIIENYRKNKATKTKTLNDITYKQAIMIGFYQVLSLIPGTSRSGTTILGGLLLGMDRSVAAEFTFLLSVPVMFGASFVKLIKFGLNFTQNEIIILIVGTLSAFIVSIFAIKFLLKYIKKHDFKVFGWYRIILGIILLLYFLIK